MITLDRTAPSTWSKLFQNIIIVIVIIFIVGHLPSACSCPAVFTAAV